MSTAIVTRSVTAGAFLMVAGIVTLRWVYREEGPRCRDFRPRGSFGQFASPIVMQIVIATLGWLAA